MRNNQYKRSRILPRKRRISLSPKKLSRNMNRSPKKSPFLRRSLRRSPHRSLRRSRRPAFILRKSPIIAYKSPRRIPKSRSDNIFNVNNDLKAQYKPVRRDVSMEFGKNEKWKIYIKKGCPFCENAKQFLHERQEKDNSIHIEMIDKDKLKEPLNIVKNGKQFTTWPKIFLNGEFIGGFQDLKTLNL